MSEGGGGGFVVESNTASSSSGGGFEAGPSRAEANRQRALQLLEEKRRSAAASQANGTQANLNGPNEHSSTQSGTNAGPAGSAAGSGAAAAAGGTGEAQNPGSFQRRGQKRDYMNYYEFNLSEMRDTKGGFMAVEENGDQDGTQGREARGKPIEKRLRTDPRIVLPLEDNPNCRHCKSLVIDANLQEHFQVHVCRACRDQYPEKYSLLTKTECKEDYLLTESELKDAELLPHWLRPNPHKTTWSNMMLYLREQVEEFAWNKWGSAEKLDEEFERRDNEKKQKKEKKHKEKMAELRKKTRTSGWTKKEVKHVHKFVVEDDDGNGNRIEICKECGLALEVEEL